MSTIRPASTGTVEERLRRLEQALTFEEEVFCATMPDPLPVTATTPPVFLSRWSWEWEDIRPLLPDARWVLYAVGFAQCPVGFTLGLIYQTDAAATIVLGSQTFPAQAAYTKLRLGPYAARGLLAPTVPLEKIPMYGMIANVTTAGSLSLVGWTFWMRMSPRST